MWAAGGLIDRVGVQGANKDPPAISGLLCEDPYMFATEILSGRCSGVKKKY